MSIRLAAYLQPDSIVDGEGIRTVIWTQGCPHHCLGCHNPETHDPLGGAEVPLEEVYKIIDTLENQTGITFSGGDPFMQAGACAKIAKYAKKKGYNIWSYTGYTFEELLKLSKTKKDIRDFLEQVDVLVDGRFVLSKKSLDVLFRGSTNQRIIDVALSLKKGEAVEIEKYNKKENRSINRARTKGVYI